MRNYGLEGFRHKEVCGRVGKNLGLKKTLRFLGFLVS